MSDNFKIDNSTENEIELESSDGQNKNEEASLLNNEDIEKLKSNLFEMEEKYKKSLADNQNTIRRFSVEREEFIKFSNRDLIADFIPVFNNMKTALSFVDEESRKNGWVAGVEYIAKQFEDVLKSKGVSKIDTIGKKFDPNLMEAVDGSGDIVLKEVSPGYYLNDRVLIPARVILSENNN